MSLTNVIKASALRLQSLLAVIPTGMISSRENLEPASHLHTEITLKSGLHSL